MDKFDEKVIGYDSIKETLRQIADVLKRPEAYKEKGVSMPRGLLMESAPGLGKSLMASILMEESGRKSFVFRRINEGNTFLGEMKDIFDVAKEEAPSILLLEDLNLYVESNSPYAPEWACLQACIDETKVRDAYKTAFDHYPSRWDSMLNTTASDCFRNALYAAAREQTIRFRDIGDLDETYCKEKEVLYDEYKLYLTLDLVKRLAAKHMPEFLTSDVLAQLTEAGILSSSIVKTLRLSTGHSKNVRLRSINRSFVNGYGRRDITTIST